MALNYFDKALNIINNISSRTYFDLSQIHFKMKNYNIALEYLQKNS
jgi:tetratricopeptide (TPR) repeat protein